MAAYADADPMLEAAAEPGEISAPAEEVTGTDAPAELTPEEAEAAAAAEGGEGEGGGRGGVGRASARAATPVPAPRSRIRRGCSSAAASPKSECRR